MEQRSIRPGCVAALALVATVTAGAGIGHAQSRGGCRAADRPSLGVAVGRSSPYFDLEPDAVDAVPHGSILVRGGHQISVRGDLSVVGPLRLRIEGSTAQWNVERNTYDPERNFELVATTSVGHVTARHIGASIGLRGGRAPVCGHVLFGGGLYSLTFRDTTLRRPGVSIAAGIDIPTGARGHVQVDVQVHIIDTNSRFPISSSKALAGALLAGWAYRF